MSPYDRIFASRKYIVVLFLASFLQLSGCVSIPMASPEEDVERKQFLPPSPETAGIYIYRNHFAMRQDILVKRAIYLDGELIGKSLPGTYFYREVSPGIHKVSTESEFSNNDVMVEAEADTNYFVRQFIKPGLFSAATGIELVTEDVGKRGVLESELAQ